MDGGNFLLLSLSFTDNFHCRRVVNLRNYIKNFWLLINWRCCVHFLWIILLSWLGNENLIGQEVLSEDRWHFYFMVMSSQNSRWHLSLKGVWCSLFCTINALCFMTLMVLVLEVQYSKLGINPHFSILSLKSNNWLVPSKRGRMRNIVFIMCQWPWY